MEKLTFDCDIFGDLVNAIDETREKVLEADSEQYGMPKEEIERQVELIAEEVQKEHPEVFIL